MLTLSDLIGSWKNSIGENIWVMRNKNEPNIVKAFLKFEDWDGIQIFDNNESKFFRLNTWFLNKNISVKENYNGKFITLVWANVDLKRTVTWIRTEKALVKEILKNY